MSALHDDLWEQLSLDVQVTRALSRRGGHGLWVLPSVLRSSSPAVGVSETWDGDTRQGQGRGQQPRSPGQATSVHEGAGREPVTLA